MRPPGRLVILACCLLLPIGMGASRASDTQNPVPDPFLSAAAEFPPADASVWSAQRVGLTVKKAAEKLKRAPDSVDAADLLLAQRRVEDALPVLRRVIEQHADQIEAAARLLARHSTWFTEAPARGYGAKGLELVALARNRLKDLPREEAARAAYALASADSALTTANRQQRYVENLESIAHEYKGSEAALIAEVDLLGARRAYPITRQSLLIYLTFAGDHPGTAAAAKALYQRAFDLSHNVDSGVRNADPTDRFFEVADTVSRLESGKYPRCQWVDDAPKLLVQFFNSSFAPWPPASVDRVLETYMTFVKTHFVLDDVNPASNGVGYVVTSKMREIAALKGDANAALEQIFSDLERSVPDPTSARYLRALSYVQRANGQPPTDRAGFVRKAIETLTAIHAQGTGIYQRKALATLATFRFSQQDFAASAADYKRYLELYPSTSYAWVAALRVGICAARLEHWAEAQAAYRAAASAYKDVPLARMTGYAQAAAADQALGRFDEALGDYQAAVDAWDPDYGVTQRFVAPPTLALPQTIPRPFFVRDPADVPRQSLSDRLAQLTRSMTSPDGATLERGRWLLERGERQQAGEVLGGLLATNAKSRNAAEARYLAHVATLAEALAVANIEGSAADSAKATSLLSSLEREPYDFAVCAARLTKATLLFTQGQQDEADRLMADALSEWQRQPLAAKSPATPLEKDGAEIRAVLFRPNGDGFFAGSKWNGFRWPAPPRRFVIVNPEVTVMGTSADPLRMTLLQQYSDVAGVLHFTTEQLAFLGNLIAAVGGTKKRAPMSIEQSIKAGYMEAPNQPVGPSLNVMAFFDRFFQAMPGHWGGWEFATFPTIRVIEFTNPEHTKARASVVIGYAGGDVLLEKVDGVWKAIKFDTQWVT